MISVFNSCLHSCEIFKLTEIFWKLSSWFDNFNCYLDCLPSCKTLILTEIFEIVLLYLTISIVICPKFLYPFLWSLHSHRIFFENLSSNLATITRNLSVISSTLQKFFNIIFMNWNNSCESCYTHRKLNFKIFSTCRLVRFSAPENTKMCERFYIRNG